MKHPNLLEGLEPIDIAPRAMPHIGGRIGVGFAGGGGSSIGLKKAGLRIDFAMNHDAAAIAMHAANCPEAVHYCQDIWHVRPEEPFAGEPIRFMWFSPDCKHFSRAKGDVPVSKKIRDLAWVICLWARIRRPDVIGIENVEEFETWGPLLPNGKPDPKRKGLYFRRFNAEMRRLGYIGAWRKYRARDWGTPTLRLRLFGQFRCDGMPITWPEPTHGAPDDPDVIAGRKLPWKTAASDVIDWDEPCHSIFLTRAEARRAGVNRPLVDATLRRLTLGLQRFVLEASRPFIVPITHSGTPRVHSVDEPVRTITCAQRGELALAVPSVASYITKYHRDAAGVPVDQPMPTITSNSFQKRPGCAAPVGLAAVHMVQNNAGPRNQSLAGHPVDGQMSTVTASGSQQALAASYMTHLRGSGPRAGHDIEGQAPTLTASRGKHVGVASAFIVKYFQSATHGQRVDEPLHTVTTKPRFALIEANIADLGITEEQRYTAWWVARLIDVFGHPDGLPKPRRGKKAARAVRRSTLIDAIDARHVRRASAVGRDGWIVWDIGMRMFTVRERYRAQGVDDDFIIDVEVNGKPITATKQGEMCGNMVCPQMSEAIARAALPELQPQMEIAA